MSRIHPKPLETQQGATLVELLVALLIAGLVFAGVYQIYTNSIRTTTVQEQVVDMQQTARVVMDQLMRELRLAGYDPSQPTGRVGILNLVDNPLDLSAGQQLILQGDFVSDNATVPDTVTYRIDKTDPAHPWLMRQLNNDTEVKFGENIENLVVTFYDGSNCRPGVDAGCAVLDVAAAASVRRVTVQLTARTNQPDKNFKDLVYNDGYRRRTLASDVVLRNTGQSSDTTRPLCPTNVTASVTGGCRVVQVTWDPPSDTGGDLAGYYIYYDQAPISTSTSAFVNITHDKDATNYSYELAVPAAGVWNIAVSSYDSSGNLCDSNTGTAQPDPVIASGSPVTVGAPSLVPSPPGSPDAPLDGLTDNQVKVMWGKVETYVGSTQPVAGLAGYRLYRATVPDMSDRVVIANEFVLPISEIVGGETSHTTEYTDNDANTIVGGVPSPPANCSIYYYQVSVVDQCNQESALSTVQSVKPDNSYSPGVTPPDNGKAPSPPVITSLLAGDDTSSLLVNWTVIAPSSSQSTPVGLRIYKRIKGSIDPSWNLEVDIPLSGPLPTSGQQILSNLTSYTIYQVKLETYDDPATQCGDVAIATDEISTAACAPRNGTDIDPNQYYKIFPGLTTSGVDIPKDGSAVIGLLSPSAEQFVTWVVAPVDCTPDSSNFAAQGFDYTNPMAYDQVAYNLGAGTSAHVEFFIDDPLDLTDNPNADVAYGTQASGGNPGNAVAGGNSANIDYAPRYTDGYYHFPNYLDPTHLDTSKLCDATYNFKVISVDGELYTAPSTIPLAIKNGGIEVDAAKTVTSDITTVDDFHHIVRFGIKNTNAALDLKINKITLKWENLNAKLEKLEVLKADKTFLGGWNSVGGTPSGLVGIGTVLTLNPVPSLNRASTTSTDDEGYIRLTFKTSAGAITSSADMRAQGSATNEIITILGLDQQDAAALGSGGTCSITTAGSVTVPKNPIISVNDTVQDKPAASTALSQTPSGIIVPAGQTVTVSTKTAPVQPASMKLYYNVDANVLAAGPVRSAAAGGGGNYALFVPGSFDLGNQLWNFVMPSVPDTQIWFYLETMDGTVLTDPFSRNFDIHPDSDVFTYVQCGTSLPVVSITKPSSPNAAGNQIVNATVTTTVPLSSVVLTVTDDSGTGVPDFTGTKTMCFGTDSCLGTTPSGSSQGWTTTYGADCLNGCDPDRTNVSHDLKVTARDVCGKEGAGTKGINK